MDAKERFRTQVGPLKKASDAILECFKNGNKVLICGNGGSAADAQLWAAELMGRFKRERKGLPALALTTDTSFLTAWSNDYEYDTIFSRQVETLGVSGDILIGISTSGYSKNVIKAVKIGKKKGCVILTLTGRDGGDLKPLSDINIHVDSTVTARIQECHLLAYHIICELVDEALTPKGL